VFLLLVLKSLPSSGDDGGQLRVCLPTHVEEAVVVCVAYGLWDVQRKSDGTSKVRTSGRNDGRFEEADRE
jgi:hypothetical protein